MRTDIRPSSLNVPSSAATAKAERIAARKEKAVMMAKVAKFVLGCYILLMFKPIMPIVSDAFQHTFNEKQHMLLVHEVHGKFHIHQELGKAGHQSDNEKSNDLKYEVEQYLYTSLNLFKAHIYASPAAPYLCLVFAYPHGPHMDILSPPPQLMSRNNISGGMFDGSLFRAYN